MYQDNRYLNYQLFVFTLIIFSVTVIQLLKHIVEVYQFADGDATYVKRINPVYTPGRVPEGICIPQ